MSKMRQYYFTGRNYRKYLLHLNAKVNSHGLEELVISCKKCECHIHLTGFSLLDDLAIE